MDKVSIPYFFSFLGYQTKCIFYSDNGCHHKLKDLYLIILFRNGQQGEKEGRTELQKLEYLKIGLDYYCL